MSRFTLHTQTTAPEAAQARLKAAESANGFLPNLIAVLANAPQALAAYQELGKLNLATSLSPCEIEVVQLTAAAVNGCDFCLAGHGKLSTQKLQLDPELIQALQTLSPIADKKLSALQTYTQDIIATRGKVSDQALKAFYAAGYGEQQALEVVLGVALASLCNYANNLAQTEINPELLAFAPKPQSA